MAAAAASTAASAANRVLVTGASGYIGTHVAGLLLKAGWTVRATVRNPDNEAKTAPLRALPGAAERLELVKADLLQPVEAWKPIVDGCTYVLHTASPFPLSDPKDKSEIIGPAVTGAIGPRALACPRMQREAPWGNRRPCRRFPDCSSPPILAPRRCYLRRPGKP